MSETIPKPDFYALNDTCLVLDCGTLGDLEHVQKQRLVNFVAKKMLAEDTVIDAVSADESVTFYCSTSTDLVTIERQCLRLWEQFDSTSLVGQHHVIPVIYGGDGAFDLQKVAKHCGLSEAQLIEAHCSVRYDVDFIGFQPGFAYMSGLPKAIQLPRLDLPRTLVPKGSVAIAGDKTAIYPANSPGGWHIIGHTKVSLFDASRNPASLFAPGDTVSFVEEK
ncbi:5-oxoprolinase subunit PxpB [Pseudoalteromonas sp. YIC-656]|uniref:5-oxoprolinase subunit PxpB n=1 Tax=Pseudoalteromonas pernae TaxID=3118054 RepID=UPI003241F425